MALADQINKVVCGAAGLIGSGLKGCAIDPANIKHLFALQAGTKLTGEITRASLRDLEKQGKLIPLNDAYDVTWASEENQVQTSPSLGLKSKIRSGLYELTAMFENGIYFQKVLSSMEGSGRWDIILIDDEDQMFGTTGRNDEFKGFRTGMFAVNPYTFKTGSEGGKTSVTIQFARSAEFDKDPAYVTTDGLDFLPSDIDGVNQVRLDVSGLTNASSTIVSKTVLDKDNDTFVSGLSAADFLVKVNGTTATLGSVTEDAITKTYSIPLTSPASLATDDQVEVLLYDSANSRRVIEVGAVPDEVLYQSKEFTGVVTA